MESRRPKEGPPGRGGGCCAFPAGVRQRGGGGGGGGGGGEWFTYGKMLKLELREKLTPAPLRPTRKARNELRSAAVRSQRLPDSAMTRPFVFLWPNSPISAQANLSVRFLDETQTHTHPAGLLKE
jgi:hypothetical protein